MPSLTGLQARGPATLPLVGAFGARNASDDGRAQKPKLQENGFANAHWHAAHNQLLNLQSEQPTLASNKFEPRLAPAAPTWSQLLPRDRSNL